MVRVSVVIPNYNYGRFLRQRMESVLNQTYTDFEIIFLDDASQDDSREVIAQFLPDPRIRVIENEVNSGSTFVQWNRGVRLCQGEYVWIAEADDYADPEFLATLVKTLDQHPEAGLAYCQSWNTDEFGTVLGSNETYTHGLDPVRWRQDYVHDGEIECRDALIFMNTIPNASAVVFRRSLFEAVGGAESRFRLSGDWMLWIRIALESGVAFHAAPLNYYRSHTSSVRAQTINDGLWIEEMVRIIAAISRRVNLTPDQVIRLREHVWKIWAEHFRTHKMSLRRHVEIYRHAKIFYPLIGQRILRGLAKRGIARLLAAWRPRPVTAMISKPSSNGLTHSTAEPVQSLQAPALPIHASHSNRNPSTGKRVLFISHDATRTGAPIILLRMLRWLKENSDLSFDILLRNGGELRDEFAAVADVFEFGDAGSKALPVVPAGRPNFVRRVVRRAARGMTSMSGFRRRAPVQNPALLDLLRSRNISLIYSNTITNGEVLAALAPLGCPVVTHVHELDHWIRFETAQEVVSATCRHSQQFIAVSQAVKKSLVENLGLPAAQVDVVHGFIPTEALAGLDRAAAKSSLCQSLGISQDAFLVGASGTTDWRKSPDLFIQVAHDVQRLAPDRPIHFLWIGGASSGPAWGKLQYDLERLGLKKRVHFLGVQADPLPFFASLSVFALTSREDPFPLVMLENAAAGNPVVCFDKTGGATEFVADGCGAAVPYLDTLEMARTIVRLSTDENLRRRWGKSGQAKARSFHNMDYGSKRILRIIDRLLADRDQPALTVISPPPAPESQPSHSEKKRRLIAMYLPQYHPIAENDGWWGKGFTEWTNVTKARPLFSGHYQPHLPTDLGFYDLRLPEVRAAQAEMAREHGIHGFCYYHYWFHGRRLLERPFQEILDSGRPDFPFCLCWANENWSRNWDGGNRELLVEQAYSREDDQRHIEWLLDAFADPRYIRVDERPLMLVYRAKHLPDVRQTVDIWQEAAMRRGLKGLYLCRVESMVDERDDPQLLGFDASVEFQPDWLQLIQRPPVNARTASWLRRLGTKRGASEPPQVYDYATTVEDMLQKKAVDHRRFPCVTPSWDNTARRSRGAVVLHNSHPDLYEHWLAEILRRPAAGPGDENLVFINAWNEWAEGNHLEPDQRFGRGYLEATRKALEAAGIDCAPVGSRSRVAA